MYLELLGMFICFAMVSLIAFQASKEDEKALEEEDSLKGHQFLGIMLMIVAAIMYAIIAVSSRNLKETPAPIILFHHSIIGFVVISIYILTEYGIRNELRMREYTLKMWLIVFGGAFCDSSAVLGTSIAYRYDRAGFTGLISYVIIVYSFMCDLIVFQEKLS